MVSKRSVSEKTTISRLTSTYSYMVLLLLSAGLIGWIASIYDTCKEIRDSIGTYRIYTVGASDVALSYLIILSCMALIAILGLLSLIATPLFVKSGSIYSLLSSVLGVVILLSIAMIVGGAMSANAVRRLQKHTGLKNVPPFIDLTIIGFVGGFVPLLTILAFFFVQRYYL